MAYTEPCLDDAKPRSHTLAFTLPNELWLDILSGITYYQLKKASCVCKTMQAITMWEEFDAVLFRRVMPSKPGPRDTEIVVHPMLKFPFSGDTGDKVYSAKDHPSIMKEYATSSASSVTFLNFRTSRFSRRWRLLDPVTVEDVISASGDFWDELRIVDRWAQFKNGSVLAGWIAAYSPRTGATDMTCEGLVPRKPESFA
ncbi:hypothetical protein JCM16303_004642 [Sporobolomyces ruberrimus]